MNTRKDYESFDARKDEELRLKLIQMSTMFVMSINEASRVAFAEVEKKRMEQILRADHNTLVSFALMMGVGPDFVVSKFEKEINEQLKPINDATARFLHPNDRMKAGYLTKEEMNTKAIVNTAVQDILREVGYIDKDAPWPHTATDPSRYPTFYALRSGSRQGSLILGPFINEDYAQAECLKQNNGKWNEFFYIVQMMYKPNCYPAMRIALAIKIFEGKIIPMKL